MTEKRFTIEFDSVRYFVVVNTENERCVGRFDTMADAKGYLELYEYFIDVEEELQKLKEENEQLKKQINELVKGIQDSAKISADAMCKRMNKNVWGDV